MCAQFLPCSRPDSLRSPRPHSSHTLHLQRGWLNRAASHRAGFARLQPLLVSQGRLDRLYVGARRLGRSIPHSSRRDRPRTPDRRPGVRRSGCLFSRWRPDCLRLHPRQRADKPLDSGRGQPQSHAAHLRTRRRFPPFLVSRRRMDRFLLGSRSTATFPPPKADGNACTWSTSISSIPTARVSNASPSTEASAAAPNGPGQQERHHLLHVGAGYMGPSLRPRRRRQPALEDRHCQRRHRTRCGRPRCQAAPNGVVLGRDRLSSPRQSRARSLLFERQAGSQGQRSALSLLVARWRARRLQPLRLQAHGRAGQGLEPESEL